MAFELIYSRYFKLLKHRRQWEERLARLDGYLRNVQSKEPRDDRKKP